MNDQIKLFAKQADDYADAYCDNVAQSYSNWNTVRDEMFAQLIVEECRHVVVKVYHTTHLELCGLLLDVDEEIAKHFGVS